MLIDNVKLGASGTLGVVMLERLDNTLVPCVEIDLAENSKVPPPLGTVLVTLETKPTVSTKTPSR